MTIRRFDTVILPEGRIDSTNAGELEQSLLEVLPAQPVLDFSRVTGISSAGLRVLRVVSLKTEKPLTVKNVSLEVYETFEVTGFTLIMNEYGAFDLKAADGRILSADLKSFSASSEKSKGMFRAAALGKNRFRLSSGEGYSSAVVGKRRSMALGTFIPGESSQIWRIEKYK